MMFIAIKTEDGMIKGKLSFYCRMLGVSRQGFYKYLAHKDRPWKYQDLADAIRAIHTEMNTMIPMGVFACIKHFSLRNRKDSRSLVSEPSTESWMK